MKVKRFNRVDADFYTLLGSSVDTASRLRDGLLRDLWPLLNREATLLLSEATIEHVENAIQRCDAA